jgi:predicted esterase
VTKDPKNLKNPTPPKDPKNSKEPPKDPKKAKGNERNKLAKPEKPLILRTPEAPSPVYNGTDIRTLPVEDLTVYASQLAGQGRFEESLIFQHYVVEKTQKGLFELSYLYENARLKNEAFYWLQEAGEQEGGFFDELDQLKDSFKNLAKDPRWEELLPYLKDCRRYWSSQEILRTNLILPQSYSKETSIPLIVGLHGDGGNEYYIDADLQATADQLQVAFLGITGNSPAGKYVFFWRTGVKAQHEHIQKAIDSVRNRLKVKKGKVLLMGFSSGAQIAFEVAVQHQADYCGSLVIAPGQGSSLKEIQYDKKGPAQAYVFVIGNELPRRVQRTRDNYAWTQKFQIRSTFEFYEKLKEHTSPDDFYQKIGSWISFILKPS